jgi:hypothetical protein
MMKLFAGRRADHRYPPAQPGRSLRLVAILSVLAILLSWSVRDAEAAELDEAVAEVRAAASVLTSRIEGMPRQAQLELGTEIRFLARAIESGLLELEQLPVAPVDPALAQELMFLADLARVVAAEIEGVRGRGTERQKELVEGLTGAARESLERIRGVSDHWSELAWSMAVEIEPTGDGTLIRMVDRTLYDAIRLGGVALLLVGLLAFGLRLLALSEVEISIRELIRQSPAFSLGGALAIVLFLAAAATITLRPALLAHLAERVEATPAPHPCDRLTVQRDQLIEARAIGHERLRDAIKDRMRPVAQDCLELDSQVAAAEAIEWLAANLDPLGTGTPQVASAPASDSETMDREIERLITTVQTLRAASDDVRAVAGLDSSSAADVGGAGGPVEEVVAEEEPARARQVVTTARVNFRAGPGTDARRLGTLPEGAEAVLLSQGEEWSNIQLDDGSAVYVASAYIRTASPTP